MSLRRLKAIIKKEFIHIFRDARSFILAIIIPMIMLFIFGYALSLDVDNISLALLDRDNTTLSRDFLSYFAGSRYFKLAYCCDDYRQIKDLIDLRKAKVGLIIPKNFAKSLEDGQGISFQALIDGTDSVISGIALGYMEAITGNYNKKLISEKKGQNSDKINKEAFHLNIKPRILYNDQLKSKNYIIPGLIALIMMVIAALLTSQTISREWENGNLELIKPSPLLPSEIIIGKLVPYFIIGMMDVVISLFIGINIFLVPLKGSLALLLSLSALFMFSALCMGIFISVITKSQLLSSQLAMVTTFLPAFLLSGFIFNIANMPKPVQILTRIIVPSRYFVRIIKDIFLKGSDLYSFRIEIISLTAFSFFMLFLSIYKLKKIFE